MSIQSTLIKLSLVATVATLMGCASTPEATQDTSPRPNQTIQESYEKPAEYESSDLAYAISTHLGVTSESAATAIERIFKDHGRPVGYITGEEGGGAITVGAKYGKGTLWMRNGDTRKVYWQGPSIGFDVGADASKVFTLVYNLQDPDYIYQRFPGVDGSAYLVAGMAVNYQRANGIVLAPVRTGIGARLGANVGYRSYTRSRSWLPF